MSAYKGSLRTYNELYRKGDEIFHSAVKAFDISARRVLGIVYAA